MVMETPSPQCVGREFVRQYYTLLHEAPDYLHRFYSHNSSFVHGGVEKPGEEQPPAIGQSEIHKKIMSLNFCDCHAKIRQVDSQATVGNGVVVQVTGELSNNGQPMRRFMQTFVLAPQSPKKYYVHNDIFRYQDEVFHDNDTDTENLEEAADSETEIQEPPSSQDNEQESTVTSFFSGEQPPPQVLSNGNMHNDERPDSPVMVEKPMEEETKVDPEPVEEPYEPPAPSKSPEPEPEPEQSAEPKTRSWADITSKNTTSGAGVSLSSTSVNSGKAPSPAKPDAKMDAGAPGAPQPQRAPRPPRDRGPRDRGERGPREEGDSERSGRASTRYPDEQQLFVGNLPHNVTDKELKNFFETYGHVVELRLNNKSGVGKLPGFGFVVFEDAVPVQRILSEKPLMFRGDHRLNVEKKKQPDGGRPGSGNRSGSARGDRGRGGGVGSRGPGLGRGGGTGGSGNMNRADNRGGGGGRGFNPRR